MSSSSVQNQAEADTPSLASHQRPETSNQRPETSHQRPGSSTFHSNRRSREDDDEQPGPSTKIAMVTSSAHIQHQEVRHPRIEIIILVEYLTLPLFAA